MDVAVRTHLANLQLPAADWGTRAAIGELVGDVAQWQRAAQEYACAVRASADRYTDEDRLGAQALR